jgi:signal transduction histidine kinase
MAVISIALGWVVAGRVLRPLRTITTAVRDISATNLHERLALAGPDDELKELGDTFNALLTRLDESFQAQRRFVANASHELRTPLARQRALGQVAIDDPDATPETLRAAHERVLAAGVQQERLIDALLTLARGQTGIDRHDRFDIADITDRVLTERRAEATVREVDVRSTIPSARACGDPRLVERLVANLVDNAIRHNLARGHLTVATEDRDGRAVLIVANTGPVIAASAVDQLFTPFRRLSADRTASGHGVGLGLSIVRAIADAHAATVTTRARHAGGLQIEVAFPRCDAHAEPETASNLRARVAALTAPGC